VSLDQRFDGGRGAVVTQVEAGSPADAAGIRTNDVVLAVNGVAMVGEVDLIGTIRDLKPGTTVSVDLMRGGKAMSLSVKLGRRAN
jgi:serine protease Do